MKALALLACLAVAGCGLPWGGDFSRIGEGPASQLHRDFVAQSTGGPLPSAGPGWAPTVPLSGFARPYPY